MDKLKFSKTDSRRTVMALAVVAMFLATLGVGNVDAAASPVSITSDKSSADIMVGDSVIVTLTLDSSDTRYRNMEVKMTANWPSGTAWEYYFLDTNEDEIPNNQVTLNKGGSETVLLYIICSGVCESGDTNSVSVYGKSDPKFYTGSSRSQCGSDDCETDTSAASSSSNVTNTVEISLTAATEHSSSVTCDAASGDGGNMVHQGDKVLWGYTLTNTGYSADSYTFVSTISSNIGAEVGFWAVTPGLTNGKNLVGTSETGDSSAEASISITAATDARPGTYDIELIVSSNGGGADAGCEFSVVVPEPDLEIKNTDITFSHNSAWINTNDKSQVVTIYVKVRNNGGTVDSSGVRTNDVEVKFYVDGAQVGAVETITSLAHGEEVTLSRDWQPGRAYDEDNEVGLSVVVKVDPADKIDESDNDNNQGTQYFKVIRAKSSTPSFFIGFFALISAIAMAVMLSSYYRNRDLE
ncbi:MAG TPA: CARDB domain-containing protein [Candidatus Poseidoniia archaeon]|nr:CARDB domain-containing protein [Candidatus Poseidoniia archaeon]